MLGATASLILGGLGMAANAVQAVQANKQKKEADAAAKQYAQDLKNVQEVNYMAGLQAPDIMSIQQEANARNTQMNIQAMQEMGAAGAAQAGNIVEANRQADLQAAQQQAVLEQQTQRQVLGTQQEIEGRRAGREEGIALMGLEGAQMAGLQAQNQKASSIEGMFGAAGLMIGGADQAVGLYGNKKKNNNWEWSAADNAAFNDPYAQ